MQLKHCNLRVRYESVVEIGKTMFSVFKKSLLAKIILPVVGIMIFFGVIMAVFVLSLFSSYNKELVDEKVATNSATLRTYLRLSERETAIAATSMSRSPLVIDAIKNRSREDIAKAFQTAVDTFGISYFTIADPKGDVFFRTYSPDSYGDSILNQKNISDAIAGKFPTYFERGTLVKVSTRSGRPVYGADGNLLGVISAGVRHDRDVDMQKLKTLVNGEVAVFLGETRIATTPSRDAIAIFDTRLKPSLVNTLLHEKRDTIDDVEVDGEKYKVYYLPLIDPRGEAFAVISIATPLGPVLASSHKIVGLGITHFSIALLCVLVATYFFVANACKPIEGLATTLAAVSDGDLSVTAPHTKEVEVGDVVVSASNHLAKTVDIIKKLTEEIIIMIAEHERGSTGYRLNSKLFHGDFRLLAINILQLSEAGIRDKLTGMPNRRNFDNKLAIEWNTALKEKISLCLMMIDIDNFRNYNDDYGHQQGDEALRAVAEFLMGYAKPERRLFLGRWGGEEFVALLPNSTADSAMEIAEEIRIGIEKLKIHSSDSQAEKLTVSIGLSSTVPSASGSINRLIVDADIALALAKKSGRNRVEVG